MKKMLLAGALATLLIAPFAASGALVQFDFGPTPSPMNWNNVLSYTAGVYVSSAVDTNGLATGMQLAIISNFYESSASEGLAGGTIYPDSASGDCLRLSAAGEGHAEILMSGLNPAWSYSFTFYAASHRDPDRRTTYTIGTNSVQLEAAHNYSNTVSISSVSPTAGGEILVNIDRIDYWGYLNVMEVDAIPEPLAAVPLLLLLAWVVRQA